MSRVFTNLKSSQLIVMGTTESSSSTTGCVTLEGGLGVKKAIVAGGWLNTNAGLYVGQSSTLVGPVSCQSNSDSAVQVAGGISCGTNLMVASGIYGSYLTANSLLYNDSNKLIKSATIDTNTLSFSSGSLSLKPNLTLTSLTTWNTRNITKDDTYPVVGDTFKMSLTGNNSLTPYGQVINVSVNSDIRNVSTLTMPSFYNMCLSGYIQPSNSFNITNVYNLFVDGFTCGSYIGVVSNAYSLYVGAPNCGAINQYLAWFQGSSYENHIDARGYVYLNGPLTLNNTLVTNVNNLKVSSIELSAGSNYTTLQASSTISSSYNLIMPASLPTSSNQILSLDQYGNMSAGGDVFTSGRIGINSNSSFQSDTYNDDLQIGSSPTTGGMAIAMNNTYIRMREIAAYNQMRLGTNMSTYSVQDSATYPSWALYMGNDCYKITRAQAGNPTEYTFFNIDNAGYVSANNITPNVIQTVSIGGAPSTTSTSWTITAFTANIQPKRTTSRIKITFTGVMYVPANVIGMATIFRNFTELSGNSNGFSEYYLNLSTFGPCNMTYLDWPQTTSLTTYTIYIRSGTAGNTVTLGSGGITTVLLLEEIYM